ncbi:MAG: 2-hydroxychromene-2-carboxylate isomerase [Pyrinomonadaceae bacterium]|nr:2-hydroxychromene-2-carboxylate isomerase [Pyrinomonadaceae bacterium]
MTAPIDFYFDFSSPYGYLASRKIEELAAKHGREVNWRPVLLGAIFKTTGGAPLTQIPLKGDYSKRDFARSARFHGVTEFSMPSVFPIASQAPARILLWAKAQDPALVSGIAHAFYRAYFVDDRDISNPDTAADDPAIKDSLKREVEAAVAAGVFGSPFVVVDGEPFWGIDRFAQVDRWLATGGF